jgi:hypothetical protein
VRTKNYAQIYEALAAKPRVIPAKILRRVKEHLYKLIQTNDPKADRYVQSFEQVAKGGGLEVYAGVGALSGGTSAIGYKAIRVNHLVKDVVFDEQILDPNILLKETLPDMLVGKARWVPIFKYMAASGRIIDGGLDTDGLQKNVIERAMRIEPTAYYPTASYARKRPLVLAEFPSVRDIVDNWGEEHGMAYVPLLPRDMVDESDLRALLISQYKILGERGWAGMADTDFRRLVCFYDWLRFAPKKMD